MRDSSGALAGHIRIPPRRDFRRWDDAHDRKPHRIRIHSKLRTTLRPRDSSIRTHSRRASQQRSFLPFGPRLRYKHTRSTSDHPHYRPHPRIFAVMDQRTTMRTLLRANDPLHGYVHRCYRNCHPSSIRMGRKSRMGKIPDSRERTTKRMEPLCFRCNLGIRPRLWHGSGSPDRFQP